MNAPLTAQQQEHAYLSRLGERVLSHRGRAVIAPGGSLVTDRGTFELLLERCRCVGLRASAEEHMSGVLAQGDVRPFRGRPAALDKIRKLLADRDRLYGRAVAAVDTSGKTVRQSLAELKRVIA